MNAVGAHAPVYHKIFEPVPQYLRANSHGFWGPVTSVIDWCERNYVHTYFVAELFNTLSNVAFLAVGIAGTYRAWRAGLEARFVLFFLGVCLVGIGSMAFHATLTLVGQQGDETPMLLTLLVWIYCCLYTHPDDEDDHPVRCKLVQIGLFIVGAAWTALHAVFHFVLAFQVGFGITVAITLVLFARRLRECADHSARRVGGVSLCFVLIAGACWLVDQFFCVELHDLPAGLPNPQLHAWWHLFMSLACAACPAFLIFARQEARGLTPKMRWVCGIYPVVDTKPVYTKAMSVASSSNEDDDDELR